MNRVNSQFEARLGGALDLVEFQTKNAPTGKKARVGALDASSARTRNGDKCALV